MGLGVTYTAFSSTLTIDWIPTNPNDPNDLQSVPVNITIPQIDIVYEQDGLAK